MVELSTSGAERPSDLVIGTENPECGRYHAVVVSINEEKSDDYAMIDFEVITGTVPKQEGRMIREFFHYTEKAIKKLSRLAFSAGLIGANEVKNVNLQDARGRHLVIEVHDDTYEKDGVTKTRRGVNANGMWPIGDDDVKDVPVDKKAVEVSRKAGKPESSAGQSSKSGASWDDL